MRKLLATLCRKLAVQLDANVGDARLIVGNPGDELTWRPADHSPCEMLSGLYIDGRRMPLVELPSSEVGDAAPDGTKSETDKP